MITELREKSLIVVAGSDMPSLKARFIADIWNKDGYNTTIVEPNWGKASDPIDMADPVTSAISDELKLNRDVLVMGLGNGGLTAIVGTEKYRWKVLTATAGTKFDTSISQFSQESALRTHIGDGLRSGTLSVAPDRVLNIVDPAGEIEGLSLPNASVYRARWNENDRWLNPLMASLIYQKNAVREIFREQSFRRTIMSATYQRRVVRTT